MDLQPQVPKDLQTQILEFFARRSKLFIALFWFVYLGIAVILIFGTYQIITSGSFNAISYRFGVICGQLALLLLGAVVLPGILGRFRVEIKITRIITLFRRQIGITVFLLALSHFMLVRFTQSLNGMLPILSYDLRETLGLIALSISFFLFLTSNNLSIRYLGRWWKKLHRLVYVILWLVVFHVALYRPSKWALLILTVAVLEVASLIYDYWKKKNAPPLAPPQNTSGI